MPKESSHSPINDDPLIKRLLSRIPDDVSERFDEEQLIYLKNALGAREWGQHSVDCRGTFKLLKWRYYFVILVGRNRRKLTDKEKRIALFINALILSIFIFLSALLLIFILYIVKSALGINLMPGYSTGIWDWFKTLFS